MASLKIDHEKVEVAVRLLASLDQEMRRSAREAMEAGGRIIYDKMREYAQAGGGHPQVITGELLNAIEMKSSAGASGADVRIGVFGGKSAADRKKTGYSANDYAYLVEYGHGFHHSDKRARPHPFVEPAYLETREAAVEAIRVKLKEALGL